MDAASDAAPASPLDCRTGANNENEAPLQPVSYNQQRENGAVAGGPQSSLLERSTHGRDSSVHDKINQYNSLATQSRHLERKTADAALKRAMLGREEAEAETRRYRDEARLLRGKVEEGKERERKVGERLEMVMENYGRTKETHAHTQALWEREIRRARKETFKSQSSIVKLQEELKSVRETLKATEDGLAREKERTRFYKQDALEARNGVQLQLEQALKRVKTLEQERDAFQALAKNDEDVASLASEEKLFQPPAQTQEPMPSAAGIAELEEVSEKWRWEHQRAERALQRVEFLEAECMLKVCLGGRAKRRHSNASAASPKRSKGQEPTSIVDAGDLAVLGGNLPRASPRQPLQKTKSKTASLRQQALEEVDDSRRSTIFVLAEGVFRTVSQAEAEAMEVAKQAAPAARTETETAVPAQKTRAKPSEVCVTPSFYSRTPSVEPPTFAVKVAQRTSLLSLLDAPLKQDSQHAPFSFNVPTVDSAAHEDPSHVSPEQDKHADNMVGHVASDHRPDEANHDSRHVKMSDGPPCVYQEDGGEQRWHTASERLHALIDLDHNHSHYHSVTTTSKVPIRDHGEIDEPRLATRLMAIQRTPSRSSTISHSSQERDFDISNNPALTPTMTREQALAQIKARRQQHATSKSMGKAAGKAVIASSSTPITGAATPARSWTAMGGRDVSAPLSTTGAVTPGPASLRRRVQS